MANSSVIIIGSGISALTAAYQLSTEKNVIIITKSKMTNSNSIMAQGGIASSIGKDDSWRSHFNDTLTAGCYHNNENAVEILVKEGPHYLSELMNGGMRFDRDKEQNLLLGKEGAHSTRRILHAGGDATGRALVLHMLEKVKERVQIIEGLTAIDFVIQNQHCIGVKVKSQNNMIQDFFAENTILATGGCGGLYSFTSNDKTITGDGIAMGYRAGLVLSDLEFIQFHPTLLHKDGKSCGLVSEAVRGEGAILVDENKRPIMSGVHPLQDLAPRDVVARTLFHEILQGKKVFLDISMIDDFSHHFPTITKLCKENEIQIENGLIPVTPGAHFSMGGIKTDKRGRTSIPGLYAVGEVACTGVHGANRLASNSLLEGIVFGNIVANDILVDSQPIRLNSQPQNDTYNEQEHFLNLPSKAQIQMMMMENVGIVRNKERLQYAMEWFENFKREFEGISLSSLSIEQLELVNMITVGWLIAKSALMRTESRGGHFREDYPSEDNLNWRKKEIIQTKALENVVYS
ncbi:L-aspartate oxidase [Bacillus timonensis]|uniref:L-aspartate oxidase n=1 Tax=Bacillus timonensis TaxID=1033734 RepID=UPI0002888602|nr:L-aspartate oxidase [Bacillus timonensis]